MKKLFSLIAVVFFAATAFSQNTVFMRAKQFNYGTRYNVGYNITWTGLAPCNILVKVDDSKLTIYSKEIQEYRVISQTLKSTNRSEYYCMSADGRKCNMLIFTLPEYPDYVIVAVEFSDACWYYFTVTE